MLNRYRCAPGLIEMAEGLRCSSTACLPTNPLVAAIGHVHVCPVCRKRSSAACRLARLSAFRAPTISRTSRSYQTRRARIALAIGTRTSPAAFQVTVGRAAKVRVIVGSAGVHPTGSPAPAHPRPPAVPPPSPPPSRPQGSTPAAPERQSARMRPIGPESRSAGHDCSQAGEALGREPQPAVLRCMRPIGLYYAQG